jgi:hypothetical protein
MSNEELDCYDHWDDGVSWNEGELNRKELSIFAYSLPDLLRLNDFWIEALVKCQHFVSQNQL